ncbi:MAG: molybdopterin-guanine dinucleotide biosynthesis protein B [Planctomycetes bacterium]|nr:molybdopterin-guanine dinucleotide biosynthesis protein B [Planctomycetota bacterium]
MFTLAFVGDSGVGKTTILAAVIRELTAMGSRVGAVKHSKEFDDPDPRTKDSARMRAAGASRVVLASPTMTAFFWDHAAREPEFEERLALIRDVEIVLVESYAAAGLPVVEVLRAAHATKKPRFAGDPRLCAIVSDYDPPEIPQTISRFSLEDAPSIARWILQLARERS